MPKMQKPILEQAARKKKDFWEEKMNNNELQILAQLISAMEDSVKRLEHYFSQRDIENFNKAKIMVLGFQNQISQIIG